MSTVTVPANCCCGSIGRTDLRQCPVDFHIWNGDVRLVSVGRVLRTFFPLPKIAPEILEEARLRGQQVDDLFCRWLTNNLRMLPSNTRFDSRDLFQKLTKWWDRQNFKHVGVQVLVGNTRHGGKCDLLLDDIVVDLKCTSKIEESHKLQVVAYYEILKSMGRKVTGCAILHVNKNKDPELVPLEPMPLVHDWIKLSDAYEVMERRGALNGNDTATDD